MNNISIEVTFSEGVGSFTARLKHASGQIATYTINKSGSIIFADIEYGDILLIYGSSSGRTKITLINPDGSILQREYTGAFSSDFNSDTDDTGPRFK